MTNKKKEVKKGGRPKGGINRPTSDMRKTLAALREMETKALKNIKDSLSGADLDKESLATAKWLITTIVTVNRAAIADEQFTYEVRRHRQEERRAEEEANKATGTENKTPRFSLRMVDDEEEN